ncbi:hypothetical protein [Mycobacterium sp. UM_CSW]|uniref:hypothetical protein n=1 Tax=Mycobacterium sp. UM_CSW TaxID=1370119 RepID=UPI0012681F11|nr:hypothetical protein [Mycobacterium sp. UM_CSW]
MPPWLPSVLFMAAFVIVGVGISLHPRFRNLYRARPAAQGPRGGAGLWHYKPMVGAWLGVVSPCVVLALVTVQLPLPLAVTATPAVLLVAALGFPRPRGAIQSCYVDHNGSITLIRGDGAIPFDLNHFRCVRMYSSQSRTMTYPSMLVLYRNPRPGVWAWLSSVLLPRVDDERVVVFFNRWWDADGYFVGPHDVAALFYQACARAGRTPTERRSPSGNRGWEVCGQAEPY